MKVITGPNWLFDLYNGYKNEKGTAEIKPVLDKYDRPILGMSVLKDPDFEHIEKVTSTDGETRHVREFLEIIDFEPKECDI